MFILFSPVQRNLSEQFSRFHTPSHHFISSENKLTWYPNKTDSMLQSSDQRHNYTNIHHDSPIRINHLPVKKSRQPETKYPIKIAQWRLFGAKPWSTRHNGVFFYTSTLHIH